MVVIGKHIGVLACSNGLGHTRRVMAISAFILKNDYDVKIDLFVSNESLKRLSGWSEFEYLKNHKNVSFIHFVYPNCQSEKFDRLEDKHWDVLNIPNLDAYDLVWSDNILQILEVRPDAILSGSFFWHEVLASRAEQDDRIENFIKQQLDLLKKHQPFIAGNEYFATPDVKNNKNFFPVGLYRYNINFNKKNDKGILFSCGLGGEELDIAKEAVDEIIKQNLTPPDVLYVEKRLLPSTYPDWIKVADFSDEMFNQCVAACIRPGLGTISDALINNIRLFSFSSPNSFEMMHNGAVIESLGVGEYSHDPLGAYVNALQFANNEELINLQQFKTIHLRTDGIFATAKFILNNL